MPRRLAVAKQAGGFDAVGWTLLGFLLGASLALFALLHADFRGVIHPFAASPAPPGAAPSTAVVTYAAPTRPQLLGPPPVYQQPSPPPAPAALQPPSPPVDALAVAGAASVHAANGAKPTTLAASASAAGTPSARADAQVDDDAAAAGLTSRAGASPQPAEPARAGGSTDLY